MKDRVPANPGRVLITPENGPAPFYATMTRADNPTQDGDPLNKNTLLKDATAALFGLGADAVPDDVLSMLYPIVNYAWKKSVIDYIEKRTAVSGSSPFYLVYDDYSGCRRTFEYSAEIEINAENGEVSLKNPQTLTVPWSNGDAIAALLKGKYVKNTYSSPDDIVFINDSSSIDFNSSQGTYYVKIQTPSSNVFIISTEISGTGNWSIIYSTDRNAYPDSGIADGAEYVFLGNPIDNAITSLSFGTIEHVGAGTFGNIDIVFPVTPKIVFFHCGTEKQEVSPYIWGLDSLTVNTGSVRLISVIPSGKTLTVKSNSSTLNALDTSGVVYTVAYLY